MTDVEASRNAWDLFQVFAKKAFPNGESLTFAPPVLTKIGAGDFRNQIASIMSSPATGFFFNVPGEDGVTLFQQGRPFGLASKTQCILDFGQEFAVAKALGKNVIEHWTASHWYYGLYKDLPMAQQLIADYTARTGDKLPSGYIHVTYSAIQSYAQAVAAAKGKSDTPTVIKALEETPINTARGVMRYRKEDHQGLGDSNFMKISPAATDVGFEVSGAEKIPAIDVVEPPSPGQEFKM
jgi:branched-chain amino acid transport system substrate-binding protein